MPPDDRLDDFNLKELACKAQRPEHEYVRVPNDWRQSCKWCGHLKPHDSMTTVAYSNVPFTTKPVRKKLFGIF